MNTFVINQASIMGREAFHSGKKSIPVHDQNLMTLIKNSKESASLLIDAWIKAWHQENLKNNN